jgi:hypothetical protein
VVLRILHRLGGPGSCPLATTVHALAAADRHLRTGIYGLAGLSGIAATQIAGRSIDRVGACKVILAGLLLALIATLMGAFALDSMVAPLACLALFDAGLFAAQAADPSTVLAIDPPHRRPPNPCLNTETRGRDLYLLVGRDPDALPSEYQRILRIMRDAGGPVAAGLPARAEPVHAHRGRSLPAGRTAVRGQAMLRHDQRLLAPAAGTGIWTGRCSGSPGMSMWATPWAARCFSTAQSYAEQPVHSPLRKD